MFGMTKVNCVEEESAKKKNGCNFRAINSSLNRPYVAKSFPMV